VSIASLLGIAADVYGDRVAVGPLTGSLSYVDLARAAAGGATLLAGAGAGSGSGAGSVAYLGENGPVVPALFFAAARAGIPFAPLNYRLAAHQLGALLDQLDRPLVVVDRGHRDLVAGDARQALAAESWIEEALGAPEAVGDGDDEGAAALLFTSGTTSLPKCVVLRHRQLVSYVLQTVELASADPDDAILVSVPPYHVAGIGTILTNVYGGRRMVYLPDFTPESWLDLVRREAVTNAMVVPTMLARIVEHLDGAEPALPRLRALAYGGARMPRTVLERAIATFGDVGFTNAYGLTETSSTIAVLGPEDHREAISATDPKVRARLASAGRLVPGVEGEIRDADGNRLGPGETGELWVRGAQVSGEYQGAGSALDKEGWFPTHDLARMDEEGYLFIEGRADDTIIRGGENIAPAEIEDVLEQHPDLREVAVVGVTDEEWGQRIAAVVVPRSGAQIDPEGLRGFVRARLRGSRTPDDVVVVEELPYGPTGKLLRRELLAALTARDR